MRTHKSARLSAGPRVTWRGATSVVGGGETIAALRKAEVLESEISHMSTGGGALLEYIGGSKLPGIEILD